MNEDMEPEERIENLENRIPRMENILERKPFFQYLFSGWKKQ